MSLLDENGMVKRMSDPELKEALGNPAAANVNPLLAAIEMSKRSRTRKRAAGIAAAGKDRGTVISGLLNEANRAGVGSPAVRGFWRGGVVDKDGAVVGYPDFSREEEEEPQLVVAEPLNFAPVRRPTSTAELVNKMRETQRRTDSIGRKPVPLPIEGLTKEDIDRGRGDLVERRRAVDQGIRSAGDMAATPFDMVADAERERQRRTAQLFPAAPPATEPPPPATKEWTTEEWGPLTDDDLMAMKLDNAAANVPPPELQDGPPAVPDRDDTRGRMQKAVMLGLMAKSFAENPSFVGGLAGGIADAGTAGLADLNRSDYNTLQRDIIANRQRIADADRAQREQAAVRRDKTQLALGEARNQMAGSEALRRMESSAMEMATSIVESDVNLTGLTSEEKAAKAIEIARVILANQINSRGAGAVGAEKSGAVRER